MGLYGEFKDTRTPGMMVTELNVLGLFVNLLTS